MTTRNTEAKRGREFRSGFDGGSFATGTRARLADRRRRRRNRRRRNRRASRAARRSKSCIPIRATRAATSPRRSSTNSPNSIKERGIIQPIVVREASQDKYEIIAGERRWRAAQRAGLHDVPIAIVEATDVQSLEFAIIENVQRADFNAYRGSGRLRRADGAVQSHAGAGGADRRQEPAVCRQPGAPVEAARAGEGAGARKASCRPATRGCSSVTPMRRRWPNWRSTKATACASSRSGCVEEAGTPGDATMDQIRRRSAGRRGDEGPRHARAGAPPVGRARAGSDGRSAKARAARCTSSTRISISSMGCCGSWGAGDFRRMGCATVFL